MDDDDVYPMGEYPPQESLDELAQVNLVDRLLLILAKHFYAVKDAKWPFI